MGFVVILKPLLAKQASNVFNSIVINGNGTVEICLIKFLEKFGEAERMN